MTMGICRLSQNDTIRMYIRTNKTHVPWISGTDGTYDKNEVVETAHRDMGCSACGNAEDCISEFRMVLRMIPKRA